MMCVERRLNTFGVSRAMDVDSHETDHDPYSRAKWWGYHTEHCLAGVCLWVWQCGR